MKNLFLFLVLVFFISPCFGQDIIKTKDNKQLNVKVIEELDRSIKYRMLDYEDGPILSLKKNQISSIEYKNGFIDLVGNQNPRKSRPFGISGGIAIDLDNGDFGLFLASVEYFIIPQINLELNIGTDAEQGYYFSTGAKVHLNATNSEKRLTPFTGCLIGAYYDEMMVQFPIGLNYITKFGLSTAISLNHMIQFDDYQVTFIELKIGWKFKI
jgi:hypothetical protein